MISGLEYKQYGKGENVILLHEGLGSLSTVSAFAQKLPFKVTAYSRFGYGKSPSKALPWSVDYMHEEAVILGQIINELNQEVHLVGHSDGASIAAIYASKNKVKSLTLIAPHFLVEDISVTSIALAKIVYEQGDLKGKLAKHHQNPDNAFYGWNGAWLNPDFRNWSIENELETIESPVMIIQGEDDQYGTMKQIESARLRLQKPPRIEILTGVKHNPMREAENTTLNLIKDFIYSLQS